MFVSVVDDAKRFTKAHHVESYLGLVPSEDSSGGKRRIGAISKQGNGYLRTLLVQAAWTILKGRPATENETPRRSDPLRAWADGVAERRGKHVAAIVLARRLAGVLWAMWRDGTAYDPVGQAKASAKGTRREARSKEANAEALERAAKKLQRRAPRRNKTSEDAAMT